MGRSCKPEGSRRLMRMRALPRLSGRNFLYTSRQDSLFVNRLRSRKHLHLPSSSGHTTHLVAVTRGCSLWVWTWAEAATSAEQRESAGLRAAAPSRVAASPTASSGSGALTPCVSAQNSAVETPRGLFSGRILRSRDRQRSAVPPGPRPGKHHGI